jgi:hypothetical protein
MSREEFADFKKIAEAARFAVNCQLNFLTRLKLGLLRAMKI